MSVILFVAAVVCVTARPPENIDYLHTVNLQYDGSQIMGLDQIDGYADVDPAMQASLKKAIEEAWPSYYTDLLQQPAASPAVSGSTAQPGIIQSSTDSLAMGSTVEQTNSGDTASTTSIPHRFRRQADTGTTPQPVVAIQPTNPTPVPFPMETETTTDFWSRTDLVHFKINFDPFSIVTTDVPANAVPTANP